MVELKVRKIGDSLGVALPKEVLARLQTKEGERLSLSSKRRVAAINWRRMIRPLKRGWPRRKS